MKSILVNGHTYHEGDVVFAELSSSHIVYVCDDLIEVIQHKKSDEYNLVKVRGIINICTDTLFYICQNAVSGANAARNDHGKKFSWHVDTRDGQLISQDTKNLRPIYEPKVLATITLDDLIDDDPMPDDWQLPYAIPEHL